MSDQYEGIIEDGFEAARDELVKSVRRSTGVLLPVGVAQYVTQCVLTAARQPVAAPIATDSWSWRWPIIGNLRRWLLVPGSEEWALRMKADMDANRSTEEGR
jgi:hypothetical protein